jgi:hypothetical protein
MDQIKTDVIGGARGKHRKEKECTQLLVGRPKGMSLG